MGPPRTCLHRQSSPGNPLVLTSSHSNSNFAPELTYMTECSIPFAFGPFFSFRAKRLIAFAFVMDEGDVELESIPQSLIAEKDAQYPGQKALNLSGNSELHRTPALYAAPCKP